LDNDVMSATERQQMILDRARADGRVDVAGLADEFDVTPETVRRDLAVLERRRLLRRTHGGAVPVERLDAETAGTGPDDRPTARQDRMARTAVRQLPDEGAVLLDATAAATLLARMLPGGRELTVVTNGLPAAVLLADRPGVTVHVLGGRTRTGAATVDRWAEEVLAGIFVDVAFLGADGVSVERGLTTSDPAEAAVKRAMIAAARRTVVLADHTTFQADAAAHFGDLADVDVLISDSALDPGLAAAVEGAGPQVVRA
jgi:DeoR family fructose operon transcriptional repressor